MGVTIKSDSDIGFKKLKERIKDLESYQLKVGIMQEKAEDNILMIARVHEYGVDIKVTPKMRGYLHYIGIHLKKDTTHIHIPERSFIRGGFDKNHKKFGNFAERMIVNVLTGQMTAKAFYETLGEHIRGLLQKYITDLSEPPLHPKTVESTGRSNPLIKTGKLKDSIQYKVVKRGL